ncbi:50S ribosomal protein L25/general stress protein Ctc [Marisediminicola senii]|uniref:50S ribosomal protein L25/general stress protein Ctc n=1 Tax=Marisediminicola senii TaxID=2711233 RepID=UPI0013ECBDB1|nr:50S ribosomal protein L25/general stress protein Ctc [Marisediminicola senii]
MAEIKSHRRDDKPAKKVETNRIEAVVRESFGKGAARKLRVTGGIPAVVYGHGTDPLHLALPGHETVLLLRKKNAIIDLQINGKSQLALVKDVQKDPVRQLVEHIDLTIIRSGEKVVIDIAVHVEGESYPGTLAQLETPFISVEAEATHIPENVVVSVEGFEEGTQILASQLVLPKGTTLITDPETLVVNVTVPQLDLTTDAEDEAAEEAEAAEAEAAEAAEEAAEAEADEK